MSKDCLTLEIESDLECLPTLRETVGSFARQNGFGSDMAQKLRFIITEAVDNAIIHGHRRSVGLLVCISLKVVGEMIEVVVRDQGAGFRMPDELTEPSLLASSHRGLWIIKCFSESMTYSCGDDGNSLKVVVK